jgi:protein CpxP
MQQAPTSQKRRWIIAAALVAAISAGGLAAASAGTGFGMHGGHHGPVDQASANKHIEFMVEKVIGDGTPQQKARLSEIAKTAFADLLPVRAQFKASHEKAHDILMQPTVDRVALEQLRVEQVQRFDLVSKRLSAALADAAEVLTPEQRERFAGMMKKRMH